ncbi:uncharacterized protein LOC128551301 [Mercenaria mercenaria]|uniref:uncharacterized protein LOC128551301 n=1 Tax=Mercenaria mercenaria TaxID=6596 RepID=UPI00234EAFB9|nr:uncharacterized protein LOC128551301 [Mercenaria mercenaria]
MCDSCDLDYLTNSNPHNDNNFLYLQVLFHHREISALLDTGSSINLMSRKLFESLPVHNKSSLTPVDSSNIVLANNQSVNIDGISSISCFVQGHRKEFDVYVLKDTSHPLILGTHFIKSNKLILDFSDGYHFSDSKIYAQKRIYLPPNSESIVYGKLPKRFTEGSNGLCSNVKYVNRKKLLVTRSVVTIPQNCMVPVKILNPTDKTVVIHRNKPLGYFQVIDDKTSIQGCPTDNSFVTPHYCNHVQVNSGQGMGQNKGDSCNLETEKKTRFMTYFQFDKGSLSDDEKFKLENCLFENKDIFVTDENPSLGLTNLVEHHIHLRPDSKSKHQKP